MLSIKETVKATYVTLWVERLNMMKRSLLPISAIGSVVYLVSSGIASNGLVVIPLYFLAAAIFCSYFVSWFRLVLCGSKEAGKAFSAHLSPVEFKMFGWLVFFRAIPKIADKALTSLVPLDNQVFPLLNLALNILIALILFRLLLVFPLTALENSQAMSKSWAWTKGVVGKLIISAVLCVLPLVILFMAYGVLIAETGPVGFSVFFSIYYVLSGTLIATYLSMVYKSLKRNLDNDNTSFDSASI